MDDLLEVTRLLLTVLLLALLVERIMEVLVSAWDYVAEWKLRMYRFWNGRALRIMRRAERNYLSKFYSGAINAVGIGRRVRHYTRSETGITRGNLVIISAAAVRKIWMSVLSRVTSTVIGVVLCVAANVNLIQLIADNMIESPLQQSLLAVPGWLQYLVTGVIIGMGSEPVHHLIKNLERQRLQKARLERLRQIRIQQAVGDASPTNA